MNLEINRRSMVVATLGIALAGCVGDSDNGNGNDGNDADSNDTVDPDEIPPGESLEELNGLEITEHELVEPEDDFGNPEVQGTVENNRDEELSYVEVSVRVYDEDETMLDSYFTNTTDLLPDTAWAFDVLLLEDYEDIDSYDIRISDSAF